MAAAATLAAARAPSRAHDGLRIASLLGWSRGLAGSHAIWRNRVSLGLDLKQTLPRAARSEETRRVEADEPENRRFTNKLVRLGREGRWADAERLFQSIPQKNTIVYGALLAAARQCGRFEEGLKHFGELSAQGLPLTEPVYVSAMRLHGGAKRCAEGLALYRDMQAKGLAVNPPPYIVALELCGPPKQLEEAERIWSEMLAAGIRPSPGAFTALLHVAAGTESVGEVEARFRGMQRHGVRPNSAHFGALLKACRNNLDFERGPAYLRDLRIWPGQRTVVHFTIAMGTFRLAGAATEESADDNRRRHIAQLVELMTELGVASDRFFFEEYVAALLGSELRDVLVQRFVPTATSIQDALHVLGAADPAIGRTSLTISVERYLTG